MHVLMVPSFRPNTSASFSASRVAQVTTPGTVAASSPAAAESTVARKMLLPAELASTAITRPSDGHKATAHEDVGATS